MKNLEIDLLITIFISFIASSGFWGFLGVLYTKHREKVSVERQALLGLLHDRIYYLCTLYIANGEISKEEYDNLLYIYKPYEALHGNGTGAKLMKSVDSLPFSKEELDEQ